jgi:hypothetical protein
MSAMEESSIPQFFPVTNLQFWEKFGGQGLYENESERILFWEKFGGQGMHENESEGESIMSFRTNDLRKISRDFFEKKNSAKFFLKTDDESRRKLSEHHQGALTQY